MKLLSILIPTLPIRIETYSQLIKKLNKQIISNNLQNQIQIVSFLDTKEFSVGEKRNLLLNKSVGKYVCFIDDDDDISDDYLSEIIRATQYDSDCITFKGEYITQGQKKDFSISTLNNRNHNEVNCFYRLPNHLSPVKREIALSCKFTDKNYGEDSDYSTLINKIIKNEYHINKKLYFYLFNAITSQTLPENKMNQTF